MPVHVYGASVISVPSAELTFDIPCIGSVAYYNECPIGHVMHFSDDREEVLIRLLNNELPVLANVESEQERNLRLLAKELQQIRLEDDQQKDG
jgi:hypothetical protein